MCILCLRFSDGRQIQIIRIYLGTYLPRKARYPSALALIIQVSVWPLPQVLSGYLDILGASDIGGVLGVPAARKAPSGSPNWLICI
jgi:hypothetical protein